MIPEPSPHDPSWHKYYPYAPFCNLDLPAYSLDGKILYRSQLYKLDTQTLLYWKELSAKAYKDDTVSTSIVLSALLMNIDIEAELENRGSDDCPF